MKFKFEESRGIYDQYLCRWRDTDGDRNNLCGRRTHTVGTVWEEPIAVYRNTQMENV